MEPWGTAEVEQYLARFKVAEAVQEAVNSAIRLKAPDPVMHVADFLEQRALEYETTQVAVSASAGEEVSNADAGKEQKCVSTEHTHTSRTNGSTRAGGVSAACITHLSGCGSSSARTP